MIDPLPPDPESTNPPESANPFARLGPRPLPFHLMWATMANAGAVQSLPAVLAGAAFWHPKVEARAAALGQELATADPLELGVAVTLETQTRMAGFLAGIEAYRAHPYRRPDMPVSVLGEAGATRLLRPEPCPSAGAEVGGAEGGGAEGGGAEVLFVPSLINPAHILDLAPGNSLLRYAVQEGLAPALIDWGDPGLEAHPPTLDDYVGRIVGFIKSRAESRGPVHLVGYCMGGNLALAAALQAGPAVRSLALLATPWDFHAEPAALAQAFDTLLAGANFGDETPVPVDLMQLFFASIDPTLAERKFRRFARLDQAGDAARSFVALEDWANDGAPLALPVARATMHDWYVENLTAAGTWQVAGRAVRPQDLQCPAFFAVPRADRIVPPGSALALADQVPQATVHRPPSGHVGMVAGSRARPGLWQPLVTWLKDRA